MGKCNVQNMHTTDEILAQFLTPAPQSKFSTIQYTTYTKIHTVILISLSALAILAGGMGGVLGETLTDAALLGRRATIGLWPFFFRAGESLGEGEEVGEGSLGFERSGVAGGLS
jgi:hypothetical protein